MAEPRPHQAGTAFDLLDPSRRRARPSSGLVRSYSEGAARQVGRPRSAPPQPVSSLPLPSASASALPQPRLLSAEVAQRLSSVPVHRLPPTHRAYMRHTALIESQRHVRPKTAAGSENAEVMELKNLKRVFTWLDVRRDGVVTIDEIHVRTQKLGSRLTLAEVSEMIWEIDDGLEGRLTWDQFLTAYYRCRENRSGFEPRGFLYLVEFLLMDRDFSGAVNVDEAMTVLYHRHGKSDLEQLTSQFFAEEAGAGADPMLAAVAFDAFFARFGREKPKVVSTFERRCSYARDATAALQRDRRRHGAARGGREADAEADDNAGARPGALRRRPTLGRRIDYEFGHGERLALRPVPSFGDHLLWWNASPAKPPAEAPAPSASPARRPRSSGGASRQAPMTPPKGDGAAAASSQPRLLGGGGSPPAGRTAQADAPAGAEQPLRRSCSAATPPPPQPALPGGALRGLGEGGARRASQRRRSLAQPASRNTGDRARKVHFVDAVAARRVSLEHVSLYESLALWGSLE